MDEASGEGIRPAGNEIIRPEVENSGSVAVKTKPVTTHNFTFKVTEKDTSVQYAYSNEVSVGITVSTEYLIGLFR